MNIEINSVEPDIDLIDGRPVLSFYFTDIEPLEEGMYQFIGAVEQSEEETTLTIAAPLKDILNKMIDLYRHFNSPDQIVLDGEARPLFEAVRADLIGVIAMIDSVKYEG